MIRDYLMDAASMLNLWLKSLIDNIQNIVSSSYFTSFDLDFSKRLQELHYSYIITPYRNGYICRVDWIKPKQWRL